LTPKITKLCFGLEIFGAKISYEKCLSKTLMKLTAGLSFYSQFHLVAAINQGRLFAIYSLFSKKIVITRETSPLKVKTLCFMR